MGSNLERLLAPVGADDPVGPDLAYDNDRHEIESAFDSSGGDADVDWRRIVSLIETQSAQTKDVWLAVYLTRAGAKSGRLELVETGAAYLDGLLQAYWPIVHPQLDEYGFQGRKGPCESLAQYAAFLAPLKRTALLEHARLGRFSGEDFERFRANGESEDGYGMFRAALADGGEVTLAEALQRLDRIEASLRSVDALLTQHAGEETGPNYAALYQTLGEIKRAVRSFTAGDGGAEEDAPASSRATPDAEVRAGDSGGRVPGRIESREDVVRALDSIADYYRRKEPASPVPLVLQRARDWVSMDFLAVLEDISPASIDDARRVLVRRQQDDAE